MITQKLTKQTDMKKRCITLVKQMADSGCGIACLAMVTCQSYEAVKVILSRQCNWSSRRKKLYTHPKDLITYLNKHTDIIAKKADFPGWEHIHGTSILGVNRNDKGYHWVIVIKDSSKFLIVDPIEAEVYQGNVWINDAEDGYVADSRSAFVKLNNFMATHIRIS